MAESIPAAPREMEMEFCCFFPLLRDSLAVFKMPPPLPLQSQVAGMFEREAASCGEGGEESAATHSEESESQPPLPQIESYSLTEGKVKSPWEGKGGQVCRSPPPHKNPELQCVCVQTLSPPSIPAACLPPARPVGSGPHHAAAV